MCSGLGSRHEFSGRSRVMGWPGLKERVGGLGCACRALDSVRAAGSGPRVELRLLHPVACAYFLATSVSPR